VVAIVSDLIGPSVVAWGSHFFCKMPRDGKTVSWHQDASYWPLTPSKAVTVWLAIDDADRGNACMKYIPGTHVLGHLTYKLTENDPTNVLNQTVPEVEKYGEPVYVELKAGEASLHSDLLLHGSEANASDRRRCGLTLRYTTGDVHAYMGWHEKGVVVAGDPPPHWGNRARPGEE
jgi:ectoine hydroxylase-related dioxygenase (phytanoyl-CoA dioxygenase family)